MDGTKTKAMRQKEAYEEIMDGGPLTDAKPAACMLGCSTRTVARLCERGALKAVKVGSLWRINRDALLEFAGLA